MSGLVPFNKNKSMIGATGFDEFYNMLDDFFNDIRSPRRSFMNDSFKIDVEDHTDSYRIDAELPGVKKEEISLDLNDGRLSITIQHEESNEEKSKNYVHRERRVGSMQRSIYLANVRNDGVTAKFENGILEITVPKDIHPEKSSRIDIQ